MKKTIAEQVLTQSKENVLNKQKNRPRMHNKRIGKITKKTPKIKKKRTNCRM